MKAIPQLLPVDRLATDAEHILELAAQEPVFLTQNGYAAGVLVSSNAWERLFTQLESLQDKVDVLEAELALARGEDELVEATPEELSKLQKLAENDALPA